MLRSPSLSIMASTWRPSLADGSAPSSNMTAHAVLQQVRWQRVGHAVGTGPRRSPRARSTPRNVSAGDIERLFPLLTRTASPSALNGCSHVKHPRQNGRTVLSSARVSARTLQQVHDLSMILTAAAFDPCLTSRTVSRWLRQHHGGNVVNCVSAAASCGVTSAQ